MAHPLAYSNHIQEDLQCNLTKLIGSYANIARYNPSNIFARARLVYTRHVVE